MIGDYSHRTPAPATAAYTARSRTTQSPGSVPAALSRPRVGDEVQFRRSATQPLERGTIHTINFGRHSVEIIDMRGKPLRVDHTHYTLIPSTHGEKPSSEQHRAPGEGRDPDVFDCHLWPGCGCPGGTMIPDCPGLQKKDRG